MNCKECNEPEGYHTLMCYTGLLELGVIEDQIAEEEAEAIDRAYDQYRDEQAALDQALDSIVGVGAAEILRTLPVPRRGTPPVSK